MKSLGVHILVELYDCCKESINDLDYVEREIIKAVELSNATIVAPVFHKFSPHGVSGVVVIAESHFTIHTWPEFGYCALDIFTCGDQIDSQKSLKYLEKAFKSKNLSVVEMKRGILNLPIEMMHHKPVGTK